LGERGLSLRLGRSGWQRINRRLCRIKSSFCPSRTNSWPIVPDAGLEMVTTALAEIDPAASTDSDTELVMTEPVSMPVS